VCNVSQLSKELLNIPTFRWQMQTSDVSSEQRPLIVMVMMVMVLMVQVRWVCQEIYYIPGMVNLCDISPPVDVECGIDCTMVICQDGSLLYCGTNR